MTWRHNPVTVNVTATDIAYGVGGDCENCPVAIAVRRAMKAKRVTVGGGRIWVTARRTRYVYSMPRSVYEFMCLFDDPVLRQEVAPFTFSMRDGTRVTG